MLNGFLFVLCNIAIALSANINNQPRGISFKAPGSLVQRSHASQSLLKRQDKDAPVGPNGIDKPTKPKAPLKGDPTPDDGVGGGDAIDKPPKTVSGGDSSEKPPNTPGGGNSSEKPPKPKSHSKGHHKKKHGKKPEGAKTEKKTPSITLPGAPQQPPTGMRRRSAGTQYMHRRNESPAPTSPSSAKVGSQGPQGLSSKIKPTTSEEEKKKIQDFIEKLKKKEQGADSPIKTPAASPVKSPKPPKPEIIKRDEAPASPSPSSSKPNPQESKSSSPGKPRLFSSMSEEEKKKAKEFIHNLIKKKKEQGGGSSSEKSPARTPDVKPSEPEKPQPQAAAKE